MGIQINGNTDNITATDGGLSITSLEINQTGISTFQAGVNVSGGQLDVGSNIKIGNAGVITATSFSGSGANLTGIDTDLLSDTSPQLGGDLDTNSHHILLDDAHAVKFGDGTDLEIQHSGSHAFMQNATGSLYIDTTGNLYIRNAAGSSTYMYASGNEVALYHTGNKKFQTYGSGIQFFGNIKNETDGTGNGIYLGAANDFQFYHDGNRSAVNNRTGDLRLLGAGNIILGRADSGSTTSYNEQYISCNSNGAVELYHDNGLRANTESYGFKVKHTNDSGLAALKLENNSTANNQTPRFDILVDLANGKNGGSIQFIRANNYQSSAAADSEIVINPAKNDTNQEALRITQDYVRLSSNNSGIQFNGDTADANALDDYERGSHTITVTGAGGNPTVNLQSGYNKLYYTKIGCMVHVTGELRWTISSHGSGDLRISIPFTADSQAQSNCQGTAQTWNVDWAWRTESRDLWSEVSPGHNYMRFRIGGSDSLNEDYLDCGSAYQKQPASGYGVEYQVSLWYRTG